MKNIKKMLGVVLAITTATSAAHANEDSYEISLSKAETCSNLEMNSVMKYLEKAKNKEAGEVFENPFNNKCTPISFSEKDTPVLTVQDFGMNTAAYSSYKTFLEMKDMQVVPAFVHEGVIYKFFKFNVDSSDTPEFYSSIRHKDFLYENKELWSFFHELMHLSNAHTHKSERSSIELQADVGATLFVSLHSKLSLEQTIEALNDVKILRREGAKQHYNRKGFFTAQKNIENLDFEYLKSFDLSKPDSFEQAAKLIDKISQDIGKLSQEDFKNKYGKLNVKGEKI